MSYLTNHESLLILTQMAPHSSTADNLPYKLEAN